MSTAKVDELATSSNAAAVPRVSTPWTQRAFLQRELRAVQARDWRPWSCKASPLVARRPRSSKARVWLNSGDGYVENFVVKIVAACALMKSGMCDILWYQKLWGVNCIIHCASAMLCFFFLPLLMLTSSNLTGNDIQTVCDWKLITFWTRNIPLETTTTCLTTVNWWLELHIIYMRIYLFPNITAHFAKFQLHNKLFNKQVQIFNENVPRILRNQTSPTQPNSK